MMPFGFRTFAMAYRLLKLTLRSGRGQYVNGLI
jgi:hypothetical protein